MKQAIAGVTPPELGEMTVMTVWPSAASTGLGRFLGRFYAIPAGFWIFTVGRMCLLLSLPLAPLLYFWLRLPGVVRRYRVTNRRIRVERGLRPTVERYVDLDRFDTIEIEVLPGQEWYKAGELIFRQGAIETFRLHGVPRPEAFRQVCLKAHQAYVGVKKALELTAAGA
jgi:hypothetical protein